MDCTSPSTINMIDDNLKNYYDPMTVVYGSTVMLQHKASGKYLSVVSRSKPVCHFDTLLHIM
jgi:hypothetical protein